MTHFGKHLVKQPQNNCHNCHNMNQIKNLAFDLGGVVLALSYENAIARFEEIGLKDARKHLDAFCQQGIFGDLEIGRISTEEFRVELGKIIGHEVTADECYYAWHGYVENVPSATSRPYSTFAQRATKCVSSRTPTPT